MKNSKEINGVCFPSTAKLKGQTTKVLVKEINVILFDTAFRLRMSSLYGGTKGGKRGSRKRMANTKGENALTFWRLCLIEGFSRTIFIFVTFFGRINTRLKENQSKKSQQTL